eukprot:1039922-Rhodomonas_salina.3
MAIISERPLAVERTVVLLLVLVFGTTCGFWFYRYAGVKSNSKCDRDSDSAGHGAGIPEK